MVVDGLKKYQQGGLANMWELSIYILQCVVLSMVFYPVFQTQKQARTYTSRDQTDGQLRSTTQVNLLFVKIVL